jgi:hypothetical protein
MTAPSEGPGLKEERSAQVNWIGIPSFSGNSEVGSVQFVVFGNEERGGYTRLLSGNTTIELDGDIGTHWT